MKDVFLGYERSNGFGTRNHILIIPTVTCSEFTVRRIARESLKYYNNPDGSIKVLNNPYGCGQTGEDLEQTTRTLINMGINPNVSGVLVLSLGCESVDYNKVADEISKYKPVNFLRIQDYGGLKTVETGIEKIKDLAANAIKEKRNETDLKNITAGLECGGSDFTSGLASNPVVGKVSDWIINNGGSTIISEVPEFIGAEHLYAARAVNEDVRAQIFKTVYAFEKKLKEEARVDFRKGQPTPGNMEGGLTTIEEKSLGAVKKSGSAKVSGVLKYGERLSKPGHYLMNTPGYDVESVSGEVAGGANIVMFTTGRGTPTGNIISPVIKITANEETFKKMEDIIDFDASPIMRGDETIESASERLKKLLIETANGRLTKAEINEQDDFAIYRIGPTY
ncbi:altronate hydrolase [Picrophilus oshimae DSM 9789]|uniref:Altronate hydrolase n=2 Tax=Picrophilus oshimae TaxID=46632 RepID=Q6L323_PICTO|nr:altronate hydrolase [Picrophilus oshimae DSM 9789]